MIWELLTLVLIVLATAFSAAGVLGYVRLPDVYTRLHATSIVATFGVVLLAVASVVATGVPSAKAVVLGVLLLLTSPATSHAIGSAALRVGEPLKRSVRNDLAQLRAASDAPAGPAPGTVPGPKEGESRPAAD